MTDEAIEDKYLIGMAAVYNKTYYYNPYFDRLPKEVQVDIQEICTFYAGKLHCVFSMKFRENGDVYFETVGQDWDMNYDEIGAKLDMDQLARDRKDFFLSLKVWYLVFELGMDGAEAEQFLEEEAGLDD